TTIMSTHSPSPVLLLTSLYTSPVPTYIYTLPLHDALPILSRRVATQLGPHRGRAGALRRAVAHHHLLRRPLWTQSTRHPHRRTRSEEHTSELQSLTNLVCRLLLDIKKYHMYYTI